MLMVILSIGGYFKDNKSIILTNMILLCAPIEIFAILIQLALSLFYSGVISIAVTAFVLVMYIALNFTFNW